MSTDSGRPPGHPSSAFRERARLEAERYGADPWVFVRELLQNARDAGASRVRFEVRGGDGRGEATVICHDDGEGMTFEHARRYLFALYASSKEGQKNQAGKFGVGFWSVLRFEPSTIVIRSRPRRGAPWGIALDGALDRAVEVEPPAEPGTEIVLRRPAQHDDDRLEHRIRDAVWQSARFLSRRDRPDRPVHIAVNGRPNAAAFALPAPSASFRRGGVRGAVGLGPAPRVELFSRGLRVRAAACLPDLLSPARPQASWMRVKFPELPGGLAPQALLESPDLEIVLSRSDARDTRALGKLVRLAQRELERLVERHVAAARPLSWRQRLGHWVGERLRALTPVRLAAGLLVGVLLVAAVVGGWRLGGRSTPPIAARGGAAPALIDQPSGVYVDPGPRYRGPSVDGFGPEAAEPLGLRYRPADRAAHFALLTFERLQPDGAPAHEPVPQPAGRYPTAACRPGNCLAVELPLATAGGPVRLPVPTGHRVAAGRLTLAGQALRLATSREGQALVLFDGPAAGVLHYRTAAAVEPGGRVPQAPAVALPDDLARFARQVQSLPVGRRVALLRDLVRRRVRYDHSPSTVDRHQRAQARGDGFIPRSLAIAAGDCDVQNGVLTALLQAAGVRARLAIGHLGADGRALPWVHAWVEYLDPGGRWRVADASETAAAHPDLPASPDGDLPVAARPPAAESVPIPVPIAPEPAAGAAPAPARPPLAVAPAFPRWLPSRPAQAALLLVAVLLTGGLLLRSRTHRTLALAAPGQAGAELAKLLRGVLQQPAAFSHIQALFHRPLVPMADGRAVSLSRARQLAGRGRLFFTRARPLLVRQALGAGAAVLDYAAEEARAVGDALGAVDLDSWARMLDEAEEDPVLAAVNRTLHRLGEDWVVRAAPDVPGGVATLDLAAVGARRPDLGARRLVAVSTQAAWLAHVRRQHQHRPQAAVFLVIDQLVRRLDLRPPRRRRLLGVCAREALLESFAP